MHIHTREVFLVQIKSCTTHDLGNVNARNATLVPHVMCRTPHLARTGTTCYSLHQPPIIPLNEIFKTVVVHIELHKLLQPKCPCTWLNTRMKSNCTHKSLQIPAPLISTRYGLAMVRPSHANSNPNYLGSDNSIV